MGPLTEATGLTRTAKPVTSMTLSLVAALAGIVLSTLLLPAPARANDTAAYALIGVTGTSAKAWWRDQPNRLCIQYTSPGSDGDIANFRVVIKPVTGDGYVYRRTVYRFPEKSCIAVQPRENRRYVMLLEEQWRNQGQWTVETRKRFTT